MLGKTLFTSVVNPLPHMPILGSSNSAPNKKNDVKDMDKWGKII